MKKIIRYVLVAGTLLLSSQVIAATLISWDFENPVTVGSVSSFASSTNQTFISGTASQTGGGPAETFSNPTSIVHLTRFFGSNFPTVTFTVDLPITLSGITFTHFHNHNQGFPTDPSYDVGVQLDSGSGFVNVGGLLNLSSANNGNTDTMTLNTALEPGTYTLRWVPFNLNGSATDTNTEFFALDNLSLNGAPQPLDPIPTLSFGSLLMLGLLLVLLGSWVLVRKRQH